MKGCGGDIQQLVESAPTENGPWTATYVDWTEFFDNTVRSHWEYEADLPYGWIRARGVFQGRSKATAAAFNHGGGCPGLLTQHPRDVALHQLAQAPRGRRVDHNPDPAAGAKRRHR